MTTEQRVKQEIVDTVKLEYQLQMVNMFEGNVSARCGDRIFITPSQVSKQKMTADMIIELDTEGNIVYLPEGLAPSSETKMHLAVYRLRKDVKAVVHNHSLYATAFAINNMALTSEALTEMNLTFGDIPVVPYGTPGTDQIYRDFDKYLGDRFALLLANHGVLTFGPNLEQAFSYAEAVEKIAHTLFIARQLGPEAKLDAKEVAGLRAYGSALRQKQIQASIEE